jgi:transposase
MQVPGIYDVGASSSAPPRRRRFGDYMKGLAGKRTRATPANMNKHIKSHISEVRAEQATNVQYDAIYLGVDLHKTSITLTRIIDHSTPQPAQRFTWEGFWSFVQKQASLARKGYVVYEAGAFGFWAARRLKSMGVECWVVHPEKLDPGHKRVQTDKRDSRHLADKLQRYVLGNKPAMVPVYVPTEAEEQQRIETRHRRKLSQQLQTLQARGRGLLLSQGIFQTQSWWRPAIWAQLKTQLCPQLQAALEDDRALIEELKKRLTAVEKKLESSAPKELPRGFGRLTFVLLMRELCTCQRFGNRRQVGGFTGLCGAVSSSGPYHLELSINKAGSPYLRTLLIELAWRMIYWQPHYKGLRAWQRLAQARSPAPKQRCKAAVVAVARQLAVDLWRWQTGRATAEQLGWQMSVGV